METSNQLSIGKRILYSAGYMALAFAMMYLGGAVGFILTAALDESNNAVLAFLGQYASFIGVWIVFIGYALIFKKEKYLLSKLGRKESGNKVLFSLGVGLVLGLGLNLAVGGVAILQKNISLTYAGFNPGMFLAFLVAITIQSGGEEIMTRWFTYEHVKKYFPETPIVPILANALFFMAFHLGNAGISLLPLVNLLLVGILYSLLVYCLHSFWAGVVAHATWNFCQNIILGLPNSGITSAYSVFSFDAANATNGFAYDTAFGIEGSIMTTILLAGACVVIFLIGRKRQIKGGNA